MQCTCYEDTVIIPWNPLFPFRAFSHWTEEYLKENFSNLTVRLEARAEDNHHLPTGKVGLGLDLLGNFMINYQNLDGYIISQIAAPMEKDVMVPPCLRYCTVITMEFLHAQESKVYRGKMVKFGVKLVG